MNIKIMVAAHKEYEMPTDTIYVPIHVGKEGNNTDFGYIGDNTGDNISLKNPNFCELTAIYWGWKNLKADYVGLSHYRRHFSFAKKETKECSILNGNEALYLCSKFDIILPKKRMYYIETLWSHYQHTHDINHLVKTRAIIKSEYPSYLSSFDKVMKKRGAHLFNMFIMKKDKYDAYCEWLFNILFKLEKQVDTTSLSAFDARLYGRVSELLLDVWIDKNQYIYKEIGFVQMGNENFLKKLQYFLLAKFFGKKYTQSR